MSKKNEKNEKAPVVDSGDAIVVDENQLFQRVSEIIEIRKTSAGTYANREITLMYWEVGKHINSVILGGGRATYGKKIISGLSTQLTMLYGKSFEVRNLRRMMQFAELFTDIEIVSTLSTQLSWSHFVELLLLKSNEARLYYAKDAVERQLGVRDLRLQISRKAYERQEIANTKLTEQSTIPFNVLKDPYLLDVLELKDNYMEADLEKAILIGLESFLLEFGRGFTFVERQKRMIVGGEDIVLDLLFYHRILKRLVAVELKFGRFKASYKGQMELYLNWLNENERQEGEESPLGIILCATANREKVELLKLDEAGIAVAEYWTVLPPKIEFESKIKEILSEAKERLERRKSFSTKKANKQIDYFYEEKGENDE